MPKYSTRHIRLTGTDKASCAIIDPRGDPHDASTDYLLEITLLGRSINTVRTYAGHIVQYLNYCNETGIEWSEPQQKHLIMFLHSLHDDEYRHPVTNARIKRTAATANAIYRTNLAYLQYCVNEGTVSKKALLGAHTERFIPAQTDRSTPRWNTVKRRTHKLREEHHDKSPISPEIVKRILSLEVNERDGLLLAILATTGMRIGETLGLRHSDLHFLPDSTSLGCGTPGSHIHVVRRRNENGALAKSRYPRRIPVTNGIAQKYTNYAQSLNRLDIFSDYLFVNIQRGKIGSPVTYSTIYDLFKRISTKIGVPVRPHDLRHYCAGMWISSGATLTVTQALLGHRDPKSLNRYLNPSFDELARAVLQANPHD